MLLVWIKGQMEAEGDKTNLHDCKLTAICWYACAVYEGQGGACWTVCPLSLDCRWSRPHTCLWILGLPATQLHHSTVTHLTPYLNSISASQVFTPLGVRDVEPAGAPLSDPWSKHTLTDKGAGSPNWIFPLGCSNLGLIGEPTNVMCNVSLHCCAISGCPILYLLHILLDFSCCSTSIVPPETPHEPAWSDVSLSLSQVQCMAKKYHQPRNMRISHKQMSWEILHVSSYSHLAIIQGRQRFHWWCELEITVNCLR